MLRSQDIPSWEFNISPPRCEDDVPLPKVGYVNSLEAATYCISYRIGFATLTPGYGTQNYTSFTQLSLDV